MEHSPKFGELITRADEEALQHLLGRPAVRLMQATLGRSFNTAKMRTALLEIRSPDELLEIPSARKLIVELLRPIEAKALSEEIFGVALAPDELLSQLRPRTTAFDRFLVALGVDRVVATSPTEARPAVSECIPAYSLFPHQLAALHKVLSGLEVHPYRVMLHMPTGSGKTRTAMQVVANHLRRQSSRTVVWLATSEELCEQAAAEFAKTWQYAGDRRASIIRAWGAYSVGPEQLLAVGPKVVIAGLAKLHALWLSNQTLLPRLGDQVSLVVFDEAHQSIAPTYRSVVDTLTARNTDARLLGLSATPGRSWNDLEADSELSAYFGSCKVALEVPGYASPIDYLVAEGYLARPTFRRVEHHSRQGLSGVEIRGLAEALDVPEDLRMRLAEDDLRNVAIVRECQRLLSRHKRLLVFAATVNHSDLLAVSLRGLGFAAQSITSKSGSAQRSRHISWFRASDQEPRVLVNFGILATGFDAPSTSAALIARPTKSLVLYSQMIGRALRGARAGGNDSAEIVTVIDTSLPGFGDLADAFSNWEDVW